MQKMFNSLFGGDDFPSLLTEEEKIEIFSSSSGEEKKNKNFFSPKKVKKNKKGKGTSGTFTDRPFY